MRLSIGIFALCATVAVAYAVPAAADDCEAIVSASLKQASVPYRGDMTITQTGQQPTKAQTVYMVNKLYTQVNGQWTVTPMNQQQLAQQINDSMKKGNISCKKIGQDSVGGEAATVYTAHNVQQGATVDTKSWISNGRNLPLKSESHIRVGSGGQTIQMTLNYTNVSAPAGVK